MPSFSRPSFISQHRLSDCHSEKSSILLAMQKLDGAQHTFMQGGKVSALTAAVDTRVKAVCLLDPVDTTVYAPQV